MTIESGEYWLYFDQCIKILLYGDFCFILEHTNIHFRIFARVQGTMGLSCLRAVYQAYDDRERAEKEAAKLQHVKEQREIRDAVKRRIKMYKVCSISRFKESHLNS